ncbi:hypothetical protein FHX82_002706 [Amycolatopsis bartoniae]|uniref:Uncharacterized protein n=1 Tax=Amycolatopsis bartoniae TaxID=941986 RepID=A0A8H9IZ97_9PSEU|nr:hypothetical protein [Amycolatopsis bartoniae]GHF60870.1 hypothetical protein GCM10017566_37800 [Amycolatopsis bartoniae]
MRHLVLDGHVGVQGLVVLRGEPGSPAAAQAVVEAVEAGRVHAEGDAAAEEPRAVDVQRKGRNARRGADVGHHGVLVGAGQGVEEREVRPDDQPAGREPAFPQLVPRRLTTIVDGEREHDR